MLNKLFEKYETLTCMILIILYIVINSFCMQNFGITDYRSTIINTIFSVFLIVLIVSLKRVTYYGLTKVTNIRQYLYFIPLCAVVSVQVVPVMVVWYLIPDHFFFFAS